MPEHRPTLSWLLEGNGPLCGSEHSPDCLDARPTTWRWQPPAETDIQRYFRVTPPTVHQMIVRLEEKSLIRRVLGVTHSV